MGAKPPQHRLPNIVTKKDPVENPDSGYSWHLDISEIQFTESHYVIGAHEASTRFLQITLSWANPVALSQQLAAHS